jgi:hypothetical protein
MVGGLRRNQIANQSPMHSGAFREFNSCGDNPLVCSADQDDHFGIEPVAQERRYLSAWKIILRSWRLDPQVVARDGISRSLSVFTRPESAHVPDMSGALTETENVAKSRNWMVEPDGIEPTTSSMPLQWQVYRNLSTSS